MIPKRIHYCWFGRKPLPELAQRCIASWHKYLPDYEIKEWNEDNFDLNSNTYVKEAYNAKKYAFVTDYVRLYALYHEGGIYMDTDVEVLKPLDKFLCHTAFSGFEDEKNVPTGIMASIAGGSWAKENLLYYNNRHFIINGNFDLTTNVQIITNYMISKGLRQDNSFQDFQDLITIYPKDYFCPKSYHNGKIYLTEYTYTIHHFAGSWLSNKKKIYMLVERYMGQNFAKICYNLFKRVFK